MKKRKLLAFAHVAPIVGNMKEFPDISLMVLTLGTVWIHESLAQPASGEIVILLEHMAGYSMRWVRPYRMTESGYKFGDLVVEQGDPIVFLRITQALLHSTPIGCFSP
jgi:hypothetical protein